MSYNFVSFNEIHHKRKKLDYVTLFPHMRFSGYEVAIIIVEMGIKDV